MSKKVRITLELDNEFIGMLRSQNTLQELGNLKEESKKHSPQQVLGLVSMLEAMGATEEQVHAETPIEWRNNIYPIPEERRVYQDGVLLGGKPC